jgi:hypothetical protein
MSSEDAMTFFVVSQVLDRAKTQYPAETPARLVAVKTEDFRLLRNDTLFVSAGDWGYKTTNDYRLHFYSAFQVYFNILSGQSGGSAESFFMNAGRALDRALIYTASLEKKDSLVKGLTVYQYLYLPFMLKNPQVLIQRDYWNDTLQYDCLAKAALAYRCDSTRIADWISTGKSTDYAIVSVGQTPLGWKKFKVDITLRNNGSLDVPLSLLLDMSGKDTLLHLKGFTGDTLFAFTLTETLLKVIVDPYKTLFDTDESNQQFISAEFMAKRKAYLMLSLLVWNIAALSITFGLMLLLGIFIHSLTALFFNNNPYWCGIFVLLLIAVKLGFPFFFYGFTLWGLVYNVFYITTIISHIWLALSMALSAIAVYAAFQKDGVVIRRLGTFAYFMLALAFVEPLLSGLVLFIR